jgi:hypothetical protein
MEYIKKQHLSFLFKIDSTADFDNTLANFPSSRELASINWGYAAVSREMVMTHLQIMMALSGKDQVLEETVTHIPLWGSTDLTALAC